VKRTAVVVILSMVLSFLVILPVSASGNIVTNGSFEEPVLSIQWQYVTPTGWNSVGGGTSELMRGLYGAAKEGMQYCELDSDGTSQGIEQTLTLVPGYRYTLSFWFSARPESATSQNQAAVKLGETTVINVPQTTPGSATSWTKYTYEFTATTTSAKLQFLNTGSRDTRGCLIDDVRVEIKEIPVTIDIKPGSDPNAVNLNERGAIPVAILGSQTFDVTTVNPDSVKLEGMSIKVVGKSNRLLAHLEDVNADGFMDLVVQIADSDGTLEVGDEEAVLTGFLYDGTLITGSDSIKIVP